MAINGSMNSSLDMINDIPTNTVWEGLERSHYVGRAGVDRSALNSLPLVCPIIILQVCGMIYFHFCYVMRKRLNPSVNAQLPYKLLIK